MSRIKDFFLRQILKMKMRGVPETERERMLQLISKNPELFKKIGEEIEKRKKSGQNETAAAMIVMRQYQSELQKLVNEQK